MLKQNILETVIYRMGTSLMYVQLAVLVLYYSVYNTGCGAQGRTVNDNLIALLLK